MQGHRVGPVDVSAVACRGGSRVPGRLVPDKPADRGGAPDLYDSRINRSSRRGSANSTVPDDGNQLREQPRRALSAKSNLGEQTLQTLNQGAAARGIDIVIAETDLERIMLAVEVVQQH